MKGAVLETTQFVGRRAELAEVRRLLGESRLVTLTGPAGSGKTRLAARVAAGLSRQFHDVWFVSLANLQDGSLLPHAVADVMEVRIDPQRAPTTTLVDQIGDREALLVLDNCEHLAAAAATLAADLLQACRRLRILATSLVPMEVMGEAVMHVPPLSVPDEDAVRSAEALARFESVNLFIDRAASALPSFRLTNDNAEAIADLCRALEGVPLALELAAARIRTLTPQVMLDRLGDRFALLSKGYSSSPPRHRSLLASVEWTFDLCSSYERELWLRVSVFTGGFELEAVEATCSGEGLEEWEILDVLGGLVDRCVVVREDAAGERSRYRMLETIRSFGLRKLESDGSIDLWRRRHLDWCAALVADISSRWVGPEQVTLLDRVRSETANLRAALEYAASADETTGTGLTMLFELEPYWTAQGQLSEAAHWAAMLLARPAGTMDERARAVLVAAWAAIVEVDLAQAQHLIDEATELVDETSDAITRAFLQAQRAILAHWRDDRKTAIRLYEKAASEFAGKSPGYEAAMHALRGFVLGDEGDLDASAHAHQAALDVLADTGELYQRSYALIGLGLVAGRRGDLATATQHLKEAVRMKGALKDYVGVAVAMETLGWLSSAEGQAERAATLLGAAAGLSRRSGMSVTTSQGATEHHDTWSAHAVLAIGQGRFDKAFAQGVDLSPVEAVAYALEERASDVGPPPKRVDSLLTRREEEVAQLLGDGASNRDIANRLVISERTAEAHVENILRKLGFHSRAQVAAWVMERRMREDSR